MSSSINHSLSRKTYLVSDRTKIPFPCFYLTQFAGFSVYLHFSFILEKSKLTTKMLLALFGLQGQTFSKLPLCSTMDCCAYFCHISRQQPILLISDNINFASAHLLGSFPQQNPQAECRPDLLMLQMGQTLLKNIVATVDIVASSSPQSVIIIYV